MMWNKVFETGEISGYSDRTLVAIALSGIKNLIAGNTKPSCYEKGLVAIAYRLNCDPTRESFTRVNNIINSRELFDPVDLVMSIGHLKIELETTKVVLRDNINEEDLKKSYLSIVHELTMPVFDLWGKNKLDWNPNFFVSSFPETFPDFFICLQKYDKVFS